jgi:hypothetical protein
MKKKNNNMWTFVLVAMVFVVMVSAIYTVWSVVTSRVSGEIDCSFNNIDYITYQNVINPSSYSLADGRRIPTYLTPECIPFVKGYDFTVCALPKDISCRGSLQNFPIVRVLVEAMK